MCGIAGIISNGSLTDTIRNKLKAASKALIHRGPDDQGLHFFEHAGICHTRLSIIDLSGGHQPIETPDGRYSAVINGEIYNHIEIKEECTKIGAYSPKSKSDSEALLQIYALHGNHGLPRVNGMFSAAIYDTHTESITLIRDRFGIKPLYLIKNKESVAFASEIKAALALLDSKPKVSPAAVTEYMEFAFQGGEHTAINGITRIPPGCTATIKKDLSITVERYYAPKIKTTTITHEALAKQFSSLMEEVMQEHMRADVPFGLFLSGGVDSAVLCALLSQMHGHGIKTYSLGYSVDRERNETASAERVAERFGTDHTAIIVTPDDLLQRLAFTVWASDELMADQASIPTSFLAERAAQDLKIVFSGEGGDEVFAGYGRFRKHPLQRLLSNLVNPGSGGYRTRPLFMRSTYKNILNQKTIKHIGAFRESQISAWHEGREQWTHMQRAQLNDIKTSLREDLLIKLDRNLMSFGLEGRVPFLDHRVVEFGLSLPDKLKVQKRVGKLFLRNWALRYLPHDHLFKSKSGFHLPLKALITESKIKKLKEVIPKLHSTYEFFNAKEIYQIFDNSSNKGQNKDLIWSIFYFSLWHRIFIDMNGARPPLMCDPIDFLTTG